MIPVLQAIKTDEGFTPEVKVMLEKFSVIANRTIQTLFSHEMIKPFLLNKIKGNYSDESLGIGNIHGGFYGSSTFNMQSIYFTAFEALALPIDRREQLQKDKRIVSALWVCVLESFKAHTTVKDMKYDTIEKFMSIYKSFGDNVSTIEQESEKEKINLWHTANWMNVLLSMVPARKSKDLAIQVVPKVVEGWDARYITGSGQKRSTAYRVAIFEKEGNVMPRERKKSSKGADSLDENARLALLQQKKPKTSFTASVIENNRNINNNTPANTTNNPDANSNNSTSNPQNRTDDSVTLNTTFLASEVRVSTEGKLLNDLWTKSRDQVPCIETQSIALDEIPILDPSNHPTLLNNSMFLAQPYNVLFGMSLGGATRPAPWEVGGSDFTYPHPPYYHTVISDIMYHAGNIEKSWTKNMDDVINNTTLTCKIEKDDNPGEGIDNGLNLLYQATMKGTDKDKCELGLELTAPAMPNSIIMVDGMAAPANRGRKRAHSSINNNNKTITNPMVEVPAAAREVTMGLGFHFSKNIDKEHSWTVSSREPSGESMNSNISDMSNSSSIGGIHALTCAADRLSAATTSSSFSSSSSELCALLASAAGGNNVLAGATGSNKLMMNGTGVGSNKVLTAEGLSDVFGRNYRH